jgi:hypothetical protein
MTAGSFIAQFLVAGHLGSIAGAGKACGTCGSDAFLPAMPAGVTDHVWGVCRDRRNGSCDPPKPRKRGPYRKA